MTSTRYLICRLALAFGYTRKNIRMGDAAAELHLLQEAESHLGKAIWRNVEEIEGLSVEYWNLRKLIKEHEKVTEKIDKCQADLTAAHEERASLLGVATEPYQDLLEDRKKVLDSLEDLARDRDLVVAKAREVRRSYDGIKTKIEVLEKEDTFSPEQRDKNTAKITELKKSFIALKKERQAIADKIAEGDARIDEIDTEILARKKERREQASEAFHHISDANQEMSTLRAEIGVLDTQMRQLYSEIGRYVSRAAIHDPDCKKACQNYTGLVDVMGALRKSIRLNHRLAEMS